MVAAGMGAGAEHACARGVMDGGVGGEVSCWGLNFQGQAAPADGSPASVLATPVMGVTAATDVTGGWEHSCAVVAGGAVVCWGNDDHGALGRLPRGDRGPWQVMASGAVAVSAGDLFACARMADQTVHCWGYNAYGQLGDGTLTDRPTPAPVRTSAQSVLNNVVEVSANARHACARRADGTVWCWGSDLCGQLGQGQTCRLSRATPIAW
jgi:alpha-tubulin suppressor-like RCC1 family protein